MREIGRRGLMRDIMVLAGVSIAPGGTIGSLFAGTASLPEATMAQLAAVADTIIPATDTPGAIGAEVPERCGKLLANWASPLQRDQILDALAMIETEAKASTGTGFAALSPQRRFELLGRIDKVSYTDRGYARLRDLIVSLYYLSEVGSTVELRYEHSPGAWEPSLRVTADTRNYGGPSSF
jgi:gluconate 2-dehydrogenase gamma chain